MQWIGRISKIKPGTAAEYDRRHNGVWPEVRAAMDEEGISNYTIFRHGDWLPMKEVFHQP